MDINRVLQILKSDCIDDPEDLLGWLATDGIEILEEYQEMKERAILFDTQMDQMPAGMEHGN